MHPSLCLPSSAIFQCIFKIFQIIDDFPRFYFFLLIQTYKYQNFPTSVKFCIQFYLIQWHFKGCNKHIKKCSSSERPCSNRTEQVKLLKYVFPHKKTLLFGEKKIGTSHQKPKVKNQLKIRYLLLIQTRCISRGIIYLLNTLTTMCIVIFIIIERVTRQFNRCLLCEFGTNSTNSNGLYQTLIKNLHFEWTPMVPMGRISDVVRSYIFWISNSNGRQYKTNI